MQSLNDSWSSMKIEKEVTSILNHACKERSEILLKMIRLFPFQLQKIKKTSYIMSFIDCWRKDSIMQLAIWTQYVLKCKKMEQTLLPTFLYHAKPYELAFYKAMIYWYLNSLYYVLYHLDWRFEWLFFLAIPYIAVAAEMN